MACDNSCKYKKNLLDSEKKEEPVFFIDNVQSKLKVKKPQIFYNHLRRSLSLRRKSSHNRSQKDISTKSLNLDKLFPKTDINNQQVLKRKPFWFQQENGHVHSQVRKTKITYSV